MVYMTLNQAAKACGKSSGTLSKAVKNGKLSVIEKNDDGSFKIDPAELFRVFPMETATPSFEQLEAPKNTIGSTQEIEILRELAEDRKIALNDLKRRLNEAELRAAKAEERLNKAHEEARAEREKLMLWLEHKPLENKAILPPVEKEPPTTRRWWQRQKKTESI